MKNNTRKKGSRQEGKSKIETCTGKKKGNKTVRKPIKKHISPKTYKRICDCANWIEMVSDKGAENMKIHRANFCKNRFCPMCAWRQACKDAMKISVLMEYLKEEHGMCFIFVTFTAPNVKADALTNEITRFNKAFYKMVEREIIEVMNHGYIRKLEITYNAERDDYHPHFHVVFAVRKSYFTGRTYISQEKWLNEWRDVMQDESITQVHVQRVKGKENVKDENGNTLRSAVDEIAKYFGKDSEYTQSQEIFDVFYTTLRGRQIITYNLKFKDANKLYKDGKLDKYKDRDMTEYFYMLLYRWHEDEDQYNEMSKRELTEAEKKAINFQALDETEVSE